MLPMTHNNHVEFVHWVNIYQPKKLLNSAQAKTLAKPGQAEAEMALTSLVLVLLVLVVRLFFAQLSRTQTKG